MRNWVEGILQHDLHNLWRWDFEKLKPKENESQYHDLEEDFEMQDGDTSAQVGISCEQVHTMTSALSDVRVPFGVTRIPQWLGQTKEGKIKASEWQSFFSIYLPLAAIDILVGDMSIFLENANKGGKTCLLIENFSALVVCTHILEAQSITNFNCLHLKEEYCNYCETSKTLFSGCTINLNHQYALHIKSQLRKWGPLIGVSEFAGERLNGILQSIPTSGELGSNVAVWLVFMANNVCF
ncbi:hypothetical protein O181_076766 [Austropuccinia psidii MF-1]|uniref:Uncharacterized protein n=1 Tax=Austropuccinia psidii MF-1 TaxID=1389203 RepID=A0A9Q3FGV2_9BASI|nr:hypothetical protein [Austropuccinia psidii MF-1]